MLFLALAAALVAAPPPEPSPFPLADAVARARHASPLRASAAALATGADAAARLAGRWPNPLIDVRGENLGAADPLAPPPDVFALVMQPIEIGPKRAARRDVAVADRRLAELTVAAVERQLALDTVRAYMRALRARETLVTLDAHRSGLQTLVETMTRRVSEGYAAEADRMRFEAEAARVDADVARTRLELARSMAELTTLVGGPALIEPAQLVAPARLPAVDQVDDTALAAAVSARPEVLLARARYERAESLAAIERLRRIPDPAVTAGYKRTAGFNTAVAGVMVSVPLFERNGQAIARAEGEARAASFDVAALERRAAADTVALVTAAHALADQSTRVEQTLLAPAEGVWSASRATFREGAADVLKLVDAERVYGEVRRDALAIRLDAFVAAIEARFALGLEEIP